jgi:hypothetical protein
MAWMAHPCRSAARKLTNTADDPSALCLLLTTINQFAACVQLTPSSPCPFRSAGWDTYGI